MNKDVESKIILAELGHEVIMTLDEFIDSGGWIEDGVAAYLLGHVVPNIHVTMADENDDNITIPLNRHYITHDDKEIYNSATIELYDINDYETVPVKKAKRL